MWILVALIAYTTACAFQAWTTSDVMVGALFTIATGVGLVGLVLLFKIPQVMFMQGLPTMFPPEMFSSPEAEESKDEDSSK